MPIGFLAMSVQSEKSLEGKFSAKLVAPCGIDCRVCRGFLRERDPCHGCRANQESKPKTVSQCKIKLCENRGQHPFCYECDNFPCTRLRAMDKRYRTRYHCSVIDNLVEIKHGGIQSFVEREKTRWRCPHCGAVLCVHKDFCLSCGASRPPME
jgi:hypothetical protein